LRTQRETIFYFNKIDNEKEGHFSVDRKTTVKITPENDINFIYSGFDNELGWFSPSDTLKVVHIEIDRLGIAYSWYCRTDEIGRRITSHGNLPKTKTISIFGCSLTFGMGLSDNETYAWKIQEHFKNYTVFNYGCPGYSLYQMLLLLERTLPID
jgi:hypothetical protein